jgi:hypothetical protein
MHVGDEVERRFDGMRGVVVDEAKGYGHCWVAFEDGSECPMFYDDLKLIETEVEVG